MVLSLEKTKNYVNNQVRQDGFSPVVDQNGCKLPKNYVRIASAL